MNASLFRLWLLALLSSLLVVGACSNDDDDDDDVPPNDDDDITVDDDDDDDDMTQPECGNGEVEEDEVCDDGDANGQPEGCLEDCSGYDEPSDCDLPACPDGRLEEATCACCWMPLRELGGGEACGLAAEDCPDGSTLTDAEGPDCRCRPDCADEPDGCPLGADAAGADWASFGHDRSNTRANTQETIVTPETVGRLAPLWSHDDVESTSTPAVVDGVVYYADWSGKLHAKNLADGSEVWTAELGRTATPSPLVTEDALFIGDGDAWLHKINRSDGALLWSNRYDTHPMANFTGSALKVESENLIIIGVASGEVGVPPYDAETQTYYDYYFRGSVLGIDADSGEEMWRLELTDDDECSGAGVSIWSSPALDLERGLGFIGTGQTYIDPDSPYADGLVAFDFRTGELVWSRQFTEDDIYTLFVPPPQGPDADVGAAPNLFTAGGRDLVGVGDKAGVYSVLDRDTGATVWARILTPGSHLGGVMSAAAYADGAIYVASNLWPTGTNTGSMWIPDFHNEENTTTVFKLDAATGETIWSRNVQYPTIGGMLYAGGLVYVGSTLGWSYALDASNGEIRWAHRTGATLASGKSIRDGILLATYGFQFIGIQGEADTAAGGIVAYALPDTPPAGPHALTLALDEFGPAIGQPLHIAVSKTSDGETIHRHDIEELGGSAGAFRWESILENGAEYTLDLYVDLDGDGACNPAADSVWRVMLGPVDSPTTVDFMYESPADGEGCQSFSNP